MIWVIIIAGAAALTLTGISIASSVTNTRTAAIFFISLLTFQIDVYLNPVIFATDRAG